MRAVALVRARIDGIFIRACCACLSSRAAVAASTSSASSACYRWVAWARIARRRTTRFSSTVEVRNTRPSRWMVPTWRRLKTSVDSHYASITA